MPKRWQIAARLQGPIVAEIVPPSEPGGLPQGFLGWYPIIDHPIGIKSNLAQFLVTPFLPEAERQKAGMWYSPVLAVTQIFAEADAIDALLPEIELEVDAVADQLSLFWTFPVSAYHLELLDLTEPVAEGEERETILFPNYVAPKDLETSFLGGVPQLTGSVDYSSLTDASKAALRWYAAGLRSLPDAQRFMAFWIALEIIAKGRSAAVHKPYKAPCGHEIPECPKCHKPTSRAVGGEQMKAFMQGECGLLADEAGRLWRMRQLMHGANRLTPDALKELPQALSDLWRALLRALALTFDFAWTGDWHPGVGVGNMWMRGRRKVTAFDLDPTVRNFPPLAGKNIIRVHTSPKSLGNVLPRPDGTPATEADG